MDARRAFSRSSEPARLLISTGPCAWGFAKLGVFNSDTLTNYELGLKSSWNDNRFRFNAAIFREDWHDFQFSFLGANGLTENRNAGDARIIGVEADLTWRPFDGFTIQAAGTYLEGEILQNYCSLLLDGSQTTDCPSVDSLLLAPSGTELPVTTLRATSLFAMSSR